VARRSGDAGFSLWTDQFNNLLDVLKTSPVEEVKRLISG
jgi:hypothetical protein